MQNRVKRTDKKRDNSRMFPQQTKAAGSGAALIVVSLAGSEFSTLGKLVVIVGNPEHDRLSRPLFHGSGNGTHFLTSIPPMIGVIGQHARINGSY